MPTPLLLLQAQGDASPVTLSHWLPVLGTIAAVVIGSVLAWMLNRRKQNAEVRKDEMDLAMSILNKLEPLHIKTLEDEATIRRLQDELAKCVTGHLGCQDIKVNLLQFLIEAEVVIVKFEECAGLLVELKRLRVQLERG